MSVLVMPNGEARPLGAVPHHDLESFRHLVIGARARGRRVSALFGHPHGDRLALVVVLAADDDGVVELARTEVEAAGFPSMTPACPEVHLFEREIAEQWGVIPLGHPWLKPVRFQPPRGRRTTAPPQVGVADYYAIEGGEVHEVAVGPVHAGVIEPGHFRLQCYGETVLHLEVSLGYQHRGVERALIGGPSARSIHYAETLAGDTTIGHATAYCQAVEALADVIVPARGLALRAIALELERLANHVGDLGAISGDVGFLPTAAFCGRLRGDYLNLSAELCGSRFGRGMVRPGGTRFDVTPELAAVIGARLERALHETDEATRLLWEAGSVQSRFEDIGRVTREVAAELGTVGLVARAAGLHRDLRTTHPSGYYRFAHVPMSVIASG
ncbi:MAG: NADH-quinone oxidoreductase subunit C, partial [Kofleriaceae bacterium]